MDERGRLAERFEEHRPRLKTVVDRMLGLLTEADAAAQDTWLRLSRSGASSVEKLGGWLATIVTRAGLNTLRSRGVHREETLAAHVPDPVASFEDASVPSTTPCWPTRSDRRVLLARD